MEHWVELSEVSWFLYPIICESVLIKDPAFHNIIAGNKYAATNNIGSIINQIVAITMCIKK